MSRLALVVACALSVATASARTNALVVKEDAARLLKTADAATFAAELKAVRAITEVKAVEIATIAAVAPRVEVPAPPAVATVAPAAPTSAGVVPVVSTPAIRPDPVVLTPPPSQVATPQAVDQLVNNVHIEDATTAVIDGDAIVLGTGRRMGALMTRAFDGAEDDGVSAEVLVSDEGED